MSVMTAEEGQIEHSSDVLDEMRERFTNHGSRSPFNWSKGRELFLEKATFSCLQLKHP
jgi:hypothetical protein